jgi:adenylosuccinate lyase
VSNWQVHPERMQENINLTRGLVFSQRVLLALTRKGLSREDAYHVVQRNSFKAWDEGREFQELLLADPEITDKLTGREVEDCFSLDPYLDKIDYIFNKVLKDED